jgi:hypothetical protein
MTGRQKTMIGAILAFAVGTGIYEARQSSRLGEQNLGLQQQQASLAEQIQRLSGERDAITRQLTSLREDNERLHRDAADLLRLRSEIRRLRNESRQLAQGRAGDANDPTVVAAQAWVDRIKLLKERFEQWPGKKTPELQLLTEQDWLNESAKRQLDSDDACREAMAHLRRAAKDKFASAVSEALEQFAKSNNEQLPSDLSQLTSYLKPPVDSLLQGYEIATPGSVHPPQPSGPNSDRAETWALVEKGDGTPGGSSLADPDYDGHVVIYRGGFYGFGPVRVSAKRP